MPSLLSKLPSLRALKGRSNPVFEIASLPSFVRNDEKNGLFQQSLPKYLTRSKPNVKIQPPSKNHMDFRAIESMLYNDLQETAATKIRVISDIIERLASLSGRKAIVSGSGPSVFCLCRTGKEASGSDNRASLQAKRSGPFLLHKRKPRRRAGSPDRD